MTFQRLCVADRRVIAAALATTVSAACAGPDGPRAESPTALPHLTTGAPTLEIGTVEGDDRYVFAAIESVIRLGDGTIAVSDAGATQISLYDPAGQHLRSWGSQGEGPSEFRALSRIYPLGPDSLLAAERHGGRVAVYDAGGELARELRASYLSGDSTFALDSWLCGRFWVEGALHAEERAAVRRALEALPPPADPPGYRVVRRTADGELWIREPATAPERGDDDVSWTRLSPDGVPVAAVSTPARFRPTHVDGDALIGVWTGDKDVPYVRAYVLEPSGERRPLPEWLAVDGAETPASAEADPDEIRSLMVGAIKNLASAQEMHYASAYSYTASLEELERFESPEGLTVDFVRADARGWSAVFTHPGLDRLCGLAYGFDIPPGWTPGLVVCAPEPSGLSQGPGTPRS